MRTSNAERGSLNVFSSRQPLRTRLISWFLLIALLPLGWMAITAYEIGKNILLEQASRNLDAFNRRQERMVDFYFQERRAEAAAFIQRHITLEAFDSLSKLLKGQRTAEYHKERQTLYEQLIAPLRRINGQDLLLIGADGLIVFSFDASPLLGKNLLDSKLYPEWVQIFRKSRTSLEVETTSFIAASDKEILHMFMAVPLLDPQQQLQGIAILGIDTSALYRFLSTASEAETFVAPLLVAEIDRRLFAISPTRPEHPTHEVNPDSSFGRYIRTLLTDSRLVDPNVDYHRRKTVMAGWRFQNAFNWAFVTNINQNRLLAPIYRFQYLFWILLAVTVSMVAWAASRVAGKIAAPILALTEKTHILAAGDLSQRIEVRSQDEIGRLGQSFNEMAAQLDHLIGHLDGLVAERTREYEQQNIELEETIRQLHATQDRLITQEKLASLGALTAGIAHEIKNPLNFINNFSELSQGLVEELKELLKPLIPLLEPQEREELSTISDTLELNIGKIYAHGKRADSIVKNMLQHSRGMPGEKVAVSLNKLLDEYAALAYHGMRAQDATFNVSIETDYDPSLPLVELVPQEMGRVFLNLLHNAYYSVDQKKKRAAPDDEYTPKVRISTLLEKDRILVKIWDNGMGMAPSVLSKLFTPFFTTKPPGEGTGLGLSLSYNIVVQGHGGMLSVESREGECAEFTIAIPASPLPSKDFSLKK